MAADSPMDPSPPRLAMQPIRPLPPMLPAQTSDYQSPASQADSASTISPPTPRPGQQEQQHPQSPTSSKSRPAKRQKVSLACQECRDRKIKCDGVRPACGPCIKKKKAEGTCVYEPERGRRGVKSQYVQLLENKVRELEDAMRRDRTSRSFPIDRFGENATENTMLSIVSNLTASTPQPPATASQSERGTPPADFSSQQQQQQHALLSDGGTTTHHPVTMTTPSSTDLNSILRNSAPESNVRGSYANKHCSPSYPGSSSVVAHTTPSPPQAQPLSQATRDGPESTLRGSFDGHGSVDDDGSRQDYYGTSSAMTFIREPCQTIDKETASSPDSYRKQHQHNRYSLQSYPQSPRTSLSTCYAHSAAADRAGSHPPARRYSTCHDHVLPPRRVADSLLKNYWALVHTLYPILHKSSFMKTYSRLWECSEDGTTDKIKSSFEYESEADPLFQCTLNLVFALGCQLSSEDRESDRESTADVFFQRSNKLLNFDVLDEGNVKVVQALLLMGQYLQLTQMPRRCWIVVGLAARVAQGLGLHQELHERVQRNSEELESQMRKRLWGGCIVLDRVVSMAYGQPFMIPVSQDVNLPQMVDDDEIFIHPDSLARQPDSTPSYMAFFVHTLQLYEIMGEILTTLYSNSSTKRTAERGIPDYQPRNASVNTVIHFERTLQSWERALPWFLRLRIYAKDLIYGALNPDSIHDRILVRQNNVLRTRYLHTCILLYRPMLAHFFASEESSHSNKDSGGLQTSLFLQSAITCVNAAQELVDVIHRNMREVLPAWWYNMFYLYTSATVLLTARLFPKVRDTIGKDRLIESWTRCLDCLSQYQSYSGPSKCCYESLCELDKMAFQNTEVANNRMSNIRILRTLPGNFVTFDANDAPQREHYVEFPVDHTDLAAASSSPPMWLRRLPVYTDLEPGLQFSQWMGRLYTI